MHGDNGQREKKSEGKNREFHLILAGKFNLRRAKYITGEQLRKVNGKFGEKCGSWKSGEARWEKITVLLDSGRKLQKPQGIAVFRLP
jgi:hypothetical protein